jgi:ABC-2 type transport system permease protein
MSEATGLAGATNPSIANASKIPLSTTLRSCMTLFRISMDRNGRSKKMMALAAIFCIPWILALVIRHFLQGDSGAMQIDSVTGRPHLYTMGETGLILTIFPYALVPLACLFYGVGMVQDEIEEQTLTYLLIRPIPRWSIYIVKLLAAALSLMLLAAVFIPVSYLAAFLGYEGFWSEILVQHALVVTGTTCLAILAYTALFGFISLLIQRSIIAGVVYIMVLEGIVGTLPFIVREGTIVFYFRTLVYLWVPKFNPLYWEMTPDTVPSAPVAVAVLLGTFAVFAGLGSLLFSTLEFRVKTPSGK